MYKRQDQYNVKVDGSHRLTLRNRKNLRIIGFVKPKDPFPDMPLATSTPLEGRGMNEKEKIKQVEKDLGSPLVKIYRDNFGRDKLYKETLKDTPSWYTPGGGSTQFYTPREEPTSVSNKASSPANGSGSAAVAPSQTSSTSPGKSPVKSRIIKPTVVAEKPSNTMTPGRAVTAKPRVLMKSTPPKIHRELRSFNKPGIKEAEVKLDEPRRTRSGLIR